MANEVHYEFRAEQVPAIDPEMHERFSPNLFAWVNRWFRNRSRASEPLEAFVDKRDGRIYLGYLFDGDVIGSCMREILTHDSGRAEVWSIAYPLERDEGFWPRYLNFGRCAVDPRHVMYFQNAENRYSHSVAGGEESVRTCTWCGFRQKLERYEVTETRERWVEIR